MNKEIIIIITINTFLFLKNKRIKIPQILLLFMYQYDSGIQENSHTQEKNEWKLIS